MSRGNCLNFDLPRVTQGCRVFNGSTRAVEGRKRPLLKTFRAEKQARRREEDAVQDAYL